MSRPEWYVNLLESFWDWRYNRAAREYRLISREIELKTHAREGITILPENQGEAFVAFLDRRIALLIERRDKVSEKLNSIYSWRR